jgi:hypothetical protein
MINNQNLQKPPKRKKFLLIISMILLIIILILFTLGGGFGLLRERIQLIIDTYRFKKASEQFYQGLEQYYQAFREDTYGGKTPQETLNMFIEALEKGDIELASKYFAMDDNLSREKWENGLRRAQIEGRISEIINLCYQFKPDRVQSWNTTTYDFVIIGNDNLVHHTLRMKLNEYSGVWKIVSM